MEVWEGPQWFPVISKDTTLTPLPSHMQILLLQVLATLSWGFKISWNPKLACPENGVQPKPFHLQFILSLGADSREGPQIRAVP